MVNSVARSVPTIHWGGAEMVLQRRAAHQVTEGFLDGLAHVADGHVTDLNGALLSKRAHRATLPWPGTLVPLSHRAALVGSGIFGVGELVIDEPQPRSLLNSRHLGALKKQLTLKILTTLTTSGTSPMDAASCSAVATPGRPGWFVSLRVAGLWQRGSRAAR